MGYASRVDLQRWEKEGWATASDGRTLEGGVRLRPREEEASRLGHLGELGPEWRRRWPAGEWSWIVVMGERIFLFQKGGFGEEFKDGGFSPKPKQDL